VLTVHTDLSKKAELWANSLTTDGKNLKNLAIQTIVQGQQGLQFEAALEQHFEDYYSLRYVALNQIYLLIGALAVTIITMVDQLTLLVPIENILQIRLPTIIFLIAIYLLLKVRFTVPFVPLLLCLAACAIHASLLMVASYAAAGGESYYQGSTLISLIFACMMLRLQFHHILPLAILLWFTQIIGMHFFMMQPFDEFIEFLVMYTLITIIAVVVAYRNEREIRHSFLMHLILKPKMWVARVKAERVQSTSDSHQANEPS